MKLTTVMIAAALVVMASSAHAEDCRQYPPGPTRFECATRNHPGVADKLERCKEEAAQMGLKPRGGAAGGGGGMRPYVQACMHRR
jgi:hypothetical protein